MFQAMNQGWGDASTIQYTQSNSTIKTWCRSTQQWMPNMLNLSINISKWWWSSKCNGNIHRKKWGREKCKWRLNSNSLSLKSRHRDGKMRWRWNKVLIRPSLPMNSNRQTFSTVLLLCLKLWWMTLIQGSRIPNFSISWREFRKDS